MAKILLMEDEENIIRVLTARLKSGGYEVLVFNDAEKALEELAKYRPDLIISDTGPQKKWLDFCKQLKKDPTYSQYRGIPYILLSAATTGADRNIEQQVKDAGVDLYVIKPYDGKELLNNISALLNKH